MQNLAAVLLTALSGEQSDRIAEERKSSPSLVVNSAKQCNAYQPLCVRNMAPAGSALLSVRAGSGARNCSAALA